MHKNPKLDQKNSNTMVSVMFVELYVEKQSQIQQIVYSELYWNLVFRSILLIKGLWIYLTSRLLNLKSAAKLTKTNPHLTPDSRASRRWRRNNNTE